jgi:hypothetical protein
MAGLKYIAFRYPKLMTYALHIKSCLYPVKVKVIIIICKAKSTHCLFSFRGQM